MKFGSVHRSHGERNKDSSPAGEGSTIVLAELNFNLNFKKKELNFNRL